MLYIRLLIEYGAYPVWLYDSDGVIDTDLPDDWKDDIYLCSSLDKIQDIYDSLFINNEKEFCFIGFTNEQKKDEYVNMINDLLDYIYKKNNNQYHIVNDIDNKFFEALISSTTE